MSNIRVAILSDDQLFTEALRPVIDGDASLMLVSVEPTPGANQCDVVLVDSRTDRVLERCAGFDGDCPGLIFLSVPDDTWAVDALAAGARGIIRKSDRLATVPKAIATVAAGLVWAPRHVVVNAWLRQRRASVEMASADDRSDRFEWQLSARECEIVRHLATGMANKELADRLAISTATVKAHLTHIFRKLGVQGRGELMAIYHSTIARAPRSTFSPASRQRLES